MAFPFRTIFSFLLIVSFQLSAQSITPFSINNGGGFGSNMEWSIGEAASIDHFSSPSYNLNTGVLQPLTNIVTAITEYGPLVFQNEIEMGPNPTANKLFIKARFNKMGTLSFQLIDNKSAILQTIEVGNIVNSYEKVLALNELSAGVYYVRVVFKSINNEFKTGIYKIIKI